MEEKEKIFKITESQRDEILGNLHRRSLLAVRNALNQLDELKEENKDIPSEENKTNEKEVKKDG